MIFPHVYVQHVTQLDPEALRASGLDGLLLDIDCTLRDWDTAEFPADVLAWLDRVRAAGIAVCLCSNGRVKKVTASGAALGAPWVAKAYKPLPFGVWRALRVIGLPASRVAIVGDQIYADVMAGRLAGVRTVLVEPTSPVEPWFTKIKRPFELPVRWWLRRRASVTPS